MKLLGILPFSRFLMEQALNEGDYAIDCTAGNGHDTLTLAKLVGDKGHVFSLDIQKQAVEATEKRLLKSGYRERVSLFQHSHNDLTSIIQKDNWEKVKAAVFNLGYLPGGDKSVVTHSDTTIEAITSLLNHLPKNAFVILVIYHGHEEGKKERDRILPFVQTLEQETFHVLQYGFINQENNPPFIIAIEKR
ncbi:hypothetical protein BTS2_1125 [Bacillus sp. TS-2]|nr:hypothetical protein BTS2_1125 [Bacillus sp. TS-2]